MKKQQPCIKPITPTHCGNFLKKWMVGLQKKTLHAKKWDKLFNNVQFSGRPAWVTVKGG